MGVIGRNTKHRLAAVTVDDEVFDGPSPDERSQSSEPTRIGRFPLIRRLGAGGMGAVYAAYDELLDRKVALKIMHPQRSGSIGQRQRTLVEARALARVTHPSVVTVYEVGEADLNIYISMEYIEGKTLSDWRGDALRSWRQILDMYLQAGDGLHAAHQAGIVHRDFKPSNVLVGGDGRPRVVDFGLARLGGQSAASVELPSALSGPHRTVSAPASADDGSISAGRVVSASDTAAGLPEGEPRPQTLSGGGTGSVGGDRVTRIGSISGTPGYMSPEQYIGGDVDARSDQFSFCAALFEALYGFLPFPGETLEELAESVHGPVRPPPPSSQVPIEVHRAILRGLSQKPDARFPNMGELLAVLRVEHGHTAAAGSMSRARILRTMSVLALAIMAIAAIRMAQRSLVTRDAAASSVVIVGAVLGLGGLYRQTLLSNSFHRRAYLLMLLGAVQILLQRVAGWQLGWSMKQIFPFEMIIWAGISAALSWLGLRLLLPLPFFLLGMGALATQVPELPRFVLLIPYPVLVSSLIWAWLRAGRTVQPRGDARERQMSSGSGGPAASGLADSWRSSPALRPARPTPAPESSASVSQPAR